MTAFTDGIAALVQEQLYSLRTSIAPAPAFAMGDVNIHISVNADASTVRALKKGGSIRTVLGKELQRS